MKSNMMPLYETMRQVHAAMEEKADAKLGEAEAHYDAAIATAREEAGLTNLSTCVPCEYCGAEIDAPCTTKKGKGKPTTPHSHRDGAYKEAVRNVHWSDLVRASKERLDGYKKMKKESQYTCGRFGQHVKFIAIDPRYESHPLTRMASRSALYIIPVDPNTHYGNWRAVWSTNVFNISAHTEFSGSELEFMLSKGVTIHAIEKPLFSAVLRFLEPPDVREAKQAERKVTADRKRHHDLQGELLDLAGAMGGGPFGWSRGSKVSEDALKAGIEAMKAVKRREDL